MGQPKLASLIDSFGGTNLSPLWTPLNGLSSVVADNEVTIPETTNFPTLQSAGTYDLTSSHFRAQVTSESTDSAQSFSVIISLNNNNQFTMELIGSSILSFTVTTGGIATLLGSVNYDPIAHLYWGIAEQSGLVVFQTSSDGHVFVTQNQTPKSFDITAIKVIVIGGFGSSGGYGSGLYGDGLYGGPALVGYGYDGTYGSLLYGG